MYRLFLALAALTLAPVTAYASDIAICYNGDIAFSVGVPKDWVSDNKMAEELGLCTIYIPKGTSFQDAPAIIYPRITTSSKNDTAAIQEVIKEASDTLKKDSKTFQLKIRPDITTKKKLKFTVRDFLDGPAPNEFERVAYIAKGNIVYLLVLSARSRKELEATKTKFMETLENVSTVDADTLKTLKKDEPTEKEQKPALKLR